MSIWDEKLHKTQKEIHKMQQDLSSLIAQRDYIEAKRKEERTLEISDAEAPNAFKAWTQFERDLIRDRFRLAIFNNAKQMGRSTQAMRIKLLEVILPFISKEKIIILKEKEERDARG
jgi:hypothetical protein